jgi:predicted lipid-binding transport protein (Tim44 family)
MTETQMKKVLMAVFTVVLALGLSLGEAQAARLGGGKSVGMQRQSVAPKPAAPAQQATPAAPTAPVGAPAAAPKRNWMGPLAGLAAGLGIAALLSHFGMGEGMANFLMIALLAMAAIFAVKWLLRRKTTPARTDHSLQYAGAGASSQPPQVAAAQYGSLAPAAGQSGANIPPGFDSEGFLRIAKLNFVRLQASNDAKSIDDIREFVAPELFAEIKMQMDERGNAPQQTDIVTLNAELLEVISEARQHVASVHFSGTLREGVGATATPFDEIWNLAKPISGDKGWVIAGIQQLS